LRKQQSLSHQVLLHCPSPDSIVVKQGLTPRGREPGLKKLATKFQISICQLKM